MLEKTMESWPKGSDSGEKPLEWLFCQAAKFQHEQIALRAYHLFLERGGTHGQHLNDWLKAEREVVARLASAVVRRGRQE
jgi:hypothetical protein